MHDERRQTMTHPIVVHSGRLVSRVKDPASAGVDTIHTQSSKSSHCCSFCIVHGCSYPESGKTIVVSHPSFTLASAFHSTMVVARIPSGSRLFRALPRVAHLVSANFPAAQRFRSSRVNGHAAEAKGTASMSPLPSHPTEEAVDEPSTTSESAFIQGEALNMAADLRTFRPGDKLEIPYELTVTDSMQDFWQSVRILYMKDEREMSKTYC